MISAKWANSSQDVKVSIIICAFTHVYRLPATLESICEQLYSNFECLVLFNQDCAISESTLSSWQDRCPLRLYTLYLSNPTQAYNRGLSLANGDYIHFLHAGDLYISERGLECMVKLAVEHFLPDMVYMGSRLTKDGSEALLHYQEYSRRNLKMGRCCAPLCSCLISRLSLLKSGRFDASLRFLADLDWMCRMYKQGQFYFACEEFFPIDSSLEQMRHVDRLRRIKELWVVLRRHFGLVDAIIGCLAQRPLNVLSSWMNRQHLVTLGLANFLWPR